MAKRKRSTALFEVIKQTQSPARPAGGGSGGGFSLSKFFARRPARIARPGTTPMGARSPADAQSSGESAPLLDAPAAAFDTPAQAAHGGDETSARLTTAELLGAPRAQSMAINLDPERRQIFFRMSYTSAIIATFAVLVVVGMAVAIGQQMNRKSSLMLSHSSTEDLQRGAIDPDVLKVTRRNTSAAPVTAIDAGSAPVLPNRPAAVAPRDAAAATTAGAASAPAAAQISPAADGKRFMGLNYIVVQSYPEEKMANEAVEFLKKNNIAATVEKGLRGWPASSFIVVGTQPFERPSAAPCKDYVAKLERLSAQFAGNKSFKAFQPMAYKWDVRPKD